MERMTRSPKRSRRKRSPKRSRMRASSPVRRFKPSRRPLRELPKQFDSESSSSTSYRLVENFDVNREIFQSEIPKAPLAKSGNSPKSTPSVRISNKNLKTMKSKMQAVRKEPNSKNVDEFVKMLGDFFARK